MKWSSRTPQDPEPKRRRSLSDLDATPVVVAFALMVLAGAVVGVALIVPRLVDSIDTETFRSPAATVAPAAVAASPTPAATANPTPTPGLPAVNGKPLSLSDLQRAWGSKGLDVRAGGGAGGFGGFAVTPADVQLSGGGGSMEVAVLVYPDAQAIKADWSLSAGAAPSPAGGRTVPAGGSIWWNQNVIVVTRSGSGSVVSSAREAFLGL